MVFYTSFRGIRILGHCNEQTLFPTYVQRVTTKRGRGCVNSFNGESGSHGSSFLHVSRKLSKRCQICMSPNHIGMSAKNHKGTNFKARRVMCGGHLPTSWTLAMGKVKPTFPLMPAPFCSGNIHSCCNATELAGYMRYGRKTDTLWKTNN